MEVSFSEWVDEGLTFTAEEVGLFEPGAWAEARCEVLVAELRTALRVTALQGVQYPAFWALVPKALWSTATWLCKAMDLTGLDRESVHTLPAATSAEGKALTVAARKWEAEPGDWLTGRRAVVENELRYVASIRINGRGVQSRGWWRECNRLTNAVHGDLGRHLKLEKKFWSSSG